MRSIEFGLLLNYVTSAPSYRATSIANSRSNQLGESGTDGTGGASAQVDVGSSGVQLPNHDDVFSESLGSEDIVFLVICRQREEIFGVKDLMYFFFRKTIHRRRK